MSVAGSDGMEKRRFDFWRDALSSAIDSRCEHHSVDTLRRLPGSSGGQSSSERVCSLSNRLPEEAVAPSGDARMNSGPDASGGPEATAMRHSETGSERARVAQREWGPAMLQRSTDDVACSAPGSFFVISLGAGTPARIGSESFSDAEDFWICENDSLGGSDVC